MGDEYNVLGNFENLNSANILKNVTLHGSNTSDASLPTLEISNIEDDSDISFELDVSPKKRAKVHKKTTKEKTDEAKGKILATDSTLSGSSDMVETEKFASGDDAPVEKVCARRVTRSLSKTSADTTLETSSSTLSTKNKRKSLKEKNLPNTATEKNGPNKTSNAQNKTRKSTRGRSKKNSKKNSTVVASSTNVETIEIDDNVPSSSTMLSFLQTGLNEPRDVMRARRNFIAERAARCPTVDVVDLISSPIVRVEGVIDLVMDSSNENRNAASNTETKKPNAHFDLSFEEDNPELSIKINWRFKPEIFKLRKYQKFLYIFEQLAKRENVEIDQILLNLKNQIIKPDDTPASIDYKIYQFIDGRAMSNSEFDGAKVLRKKKRDPNVIKLKVQSDKWKKPLNMEMLKTDNFRTLVIKCAEELKMPYEKIKLSFDGENLQNEQTPVDVELEGGEIIEIHLKS